MGGTAETGGGLGFYATQSVDRVTILDAQSDRTGCPESQGTSSQNATYENGIRLGLVDYQMNGGNAGISYQIADKSRGPTHRDMRLSFKRRR